jgi:hypothetical protein
VILYLSEFRTAKAKKAKKEEERRKVGDFKVHFKEGIQR